MSYTQQYNLTILSTFQKHTYISNESINRAYNTFFYYYFPVFFIIWILLIIFFICSLWERLWGTYIDWLRRSWSLPCRTSWHTDHNLPRPANPV